MTTVNPTVSSPQGQGGGVVQYTWTGFKTGDTVTEIGPLFNDGALDAAFQVSGTFGSGTAVLQGSEDNTNYATVKDRNGTAVSGTAAYRAEVTTAALYLKPSTTGGSADTLTAILTTRSKK